jgi:hypothetical protein
MSELTGATEQERKSKGCCGAYENTRCTCPPKRAHCNCYWCDCL